MTTISIIIVATALLPVKSLLDDLKVSIHILDLSAFLSLRPYHRAKSSSEGSIPRREECLWSSSTTFQPRPIACSEGCLLSSERRPPVSYLKFKSCVTWLTALLEYYTGAIVSGFIAAAVTWLAPAACRSSMFGFHALQPIPMYSIRWDYTSRRGAIGFSCWCYL